MTENNQNIEKLKYYENIKIDEPELRSRRFTVAITPTDHEKLKEIAWIYNKSVSFIVQEAIVQYIEQFEKKHKIKIK